MRRISIVIVIAAACILLMRCNSFYATATPYAPLHDGKNDLNSNFSIGAAGVNAAVSYSPINHLYLGGIGHGFRRDEQHCYTTGPIIGYYHNSPDSNFHFDFQLGYLWGKSHYGGFGVGGNAYYRIVHSQIFVCHRIGKKKNANFGMGAFLNPVTFNFSNMSYDFYNGPAPLPDKMTVAGIFMLFERRIRAVHGLKLGWQFGFQYGMSDVGEPDMFTQYQPLIFRFGVSYQFHPFSRKRK